MFSRTAPPGILLEAVPWAFMAMNQKGVGRFVNRQTKLVSDHGGA